MLQGMGTVSDRRLDWLRTRRAGTGAIRDTSLGLKHRVCTSDRPCAQAHPPRLRKEKIGFEHFETVVGDQPAHQLTVCNAPLPLDRQPGLGSRNPMSDRLHP
jgi:hypothetical protein